MNTLFVIISKEHPTFFVYQLADSQKKLIRITPQFEIRESTIASLFQQETLTNFLAIFSGEVMTIHHYLLVEMSTILAILYRDTDIVKVSNPQAFTSAETPYTTFAKGKIALTQNALAEFVSYQEGIDAEGVFQRQEHILRLLKNKLLLEKSPLALKRTFQDLKQLFVTDIGVKDLLTLFLTNKKQGKQKIERILYK